MFYEFSFENFSDFIFILPEILLCIFAMLSLVIGVYKDKSQAVSQINICTLFILLYP